MGSSEINTFNLLQQMQRNDVEIYHYLDSAPCGVTLHSHDFYELYCLLQGKMNYVVSGYRYALTPGTLLLIPPGEMHRPDIEGPPRPFERIVLWMNPSFIRSVSGLLPHMLPAFGGGREGWHLFSPDEKTYGVLLNLLNSLLYEKERADADSPYLCHLILAQLIIHLNRIRNRLAASADKPGARYAEIMNVYEYINAHYRQKINVNRLSELFFMDRNTLTRQFRRIIGLTPGEYIRRKRLESAYEMIQKGAGVLDAGYRSGFTDYSAFYRAFIQTYGLPPSQIPASARKDRKGGAPEKREG